MTGVLDTWLQEAAAGEKTRAQVREEQAGRVARILAGQTEAGRAFVLDPRDYVSLRCPRRAGKSFAMASKAVYVAETRPGARILVISLTLKSTKENYWSGAPSGIFRMDQEFNLGLRYHHTDLVWWHQNGSRGRLAGAETRADIEYLRGAAAEADLVILDECKSFAPQLLQELIIEVLEPGLMTRDGKIVMGGTPGLLPYGPFWEATDPKARVTVGSGLSKRELVTCVPAQDWDRVVTAMNAEHQGPDEDDEAKRSEPWSLHSWTIKENTKVPAQWKRALRIKSKAGWTDDSPSWRREYLGEWVSGSDGLVYHAYARARNEERKVIWYPEPGRDNPAGLPPEDGPWHVLMGLDFGFEDDTGVVVAAYSERLAELRHVHSEKHRHLLPDQVAALVENLVRRFGPPEVIVGDAGALGGKVYVETLAQRHGIHVEKADKTAKFDHIELVNSDFESGRIKIIPGSELDHELLGLQWDLNKNPSKDSLARLGKLREDPRCPNHLADCLLYLWRYAYHYFAKREDHGPARGTAEWWAAQAKAAEARVAARRDGARLFTTDGYPGDRGRPMTRDTLLWEQAARRV